MEAVQQIIQQITNGISNMWASEGPQRYILLIVPAFAIIYAIVAIVQIRLRAKAVSEFKTKHSNATSLLLKSGGTWITPHSMRINGVNGQEYVWETKGGKYRYWFTPGEVDISVSYQKSRPGIIYRSVTKTYGPVKLNLNLEANKSYALRFVKENFELNEL